MDVGCPFNLAGFGNGDAEDKVEGRLGGECSYVCTGEVMFCVFREHESVCSAMTVFDVEFVFWRDGEIVFGVVVKPCCHGFGQCGRDVVVRGIGLVGPPAWRKQEKRLYEETGYRAEIGEPALYDGHFRNSGYGWWEIRVLVQVPVCCDIIAGWKELVVFVRILGE